jgi:hypothetical protein
MPCILAHFLPRACTLLPTALAQIVGLGAEGVESLAMIMRRELHSKLDGIMIPSFDVSQATVSRYMPRWGYPPAQGWRTFLRNQAFAIGTIGLGEAGRLTDELLALVRGWIARVVPCATKVRAVIGKLVEPSSTLQPLRPHRSSNRTDWRDPPTTLGGDNWTMAGRRLSAYRSRTFRTTIAMARTRQATHSSRKPICIARPPRTTRSTTNDPQCPSPTRRPFCESATADKVLRNHRSVGMSMGKMLAFAVISSLVGTSDAFAQDCYRVHTQPGHPRVLEMRLTNDSSVPPRVYLGVSKFHLKGVEGNGLLHVITVRSITGGPPATEGWIEQKFRGDPTNCVPSGIPRRR